MKDICQIIPADANQRDIEYKNFTFLYITFDGEADIKLLRQFAPEAQSADKVPLGCKLAWQSIHLCSISVFVAPVGAVRRQWQINCIAYLRESPILDRDD